MPANWAKFIPDLASTLQSQKFTKPGGAGISYELPKQESVVGNPLNSALKSIKLITLIRLTLIHYLVDMILVNKLLNII